MQILYVWIEDYKCFQQQGFNLGGKYRFDYDPVKNVLGVKEDPLYIEGFFNVEGDLGVDIKNVTAIIGQNGAGKSTLFNFIIENVNLLEVGFAEKCILVVKDQGKYICLQNLSSKLVVISNTINILTKYFKDGKKYSFKEAARRAIVDLSTTTFVSCAIGFDGKKTPTTFQEYYDLTTNNLLYNDYVERIEKTGINLNKYSESQVAIHRICEITRQLHLLREIENNIVLKDHLLSAVRLPDKLILTLNTRFIRSFIGELSVQKLNNNQSFEKIGLLIFSKYFKTDFDWKDYLKLELSLNFYSAYGFAQENNLSEYINNFNTYIKNVNNAKDLLKLFITADRLNSTNYNLLRLFDFIDDETIKPIFQENSNMPLQFYIERTNVKFFHFLSVYSDIIFFFDFFQFDWSGMSSGEIARLSLFSRLHSISDYMGNSDQLSEDVVLFLDECDLFFHPKWQREYLLTLLKFLHYDWKIVPAKSEIGVYRNPEFKSKVPTRTLQIILTSNQPVITSDLPKSNVIFIRRDDDGKSTVLGDIETKKMFSFGANIHDLYAHSFFMDDGFIGKFAEKKIHNVLEKLKKLKAKDTTIASADDDNEWEIQEIKKLAEIIDEPFISFSIKKQIAEIIGDEDVKRKYIEDQITNWQNELKKLNKGV